MAPIEKELERTAVQLEDDGSVVTFRVTFDERNSLQGRSNRIPVNRVWHSLNLPEVWKLLFPWNLDQVSKGTSSRDPTGETEAGTD